MNKIDELISRLCPNGVEFKSLSEVCNNIFSGGTPKTSNDDYYGGDIPWLRSGEVNFNEIRDSEIKITEKGFNESSTKWIKPKSVLIALTGATVARSAINEIALTANQSVCAMEVSDKISYKFLYYTIANKYNEIKGMAQGALTSINLTIIKAIKIAVPPMEVQNEIVHILDDFTLLSAELSAELKARQKQYEYYRNEIIKKCKGKNGKLIELLSQPITDGPHTTPKLYPNGIPFVSATAVYNGKVHLEDAKGYISKEFDSECAKKYKPKRNDVYMVKSGSTTGKVAYVDFDDDFNIWSPLAAMRTNNEITSRYLYHLLQTTDVQNQVLARMSHGSQPNLSMRVLEQFDVKIPELSEQKRIVNILDKLDFLCNDIFNGLPAEIEARQKQYEYYRDKLLTFKELKVEN